MKKLFSTLFTALLAIPGLAQTNFRPLTLDQAVEQAKKENKLVFVDFYTDWCGPCRVMANTVFPQKKVGDYFNARFVCIKLNAEKEGKADAATYQVKAYPTFLVLDTDKKVKLDIKGSMTADNFISKIESELNPELSPEAMKKRYDAGERTPELVNAYAFHFMEEGKEEEGFRRFCTAVATDMGYYDDSVRDHLLGLDAALIEANHDRGMLANGPYPMYLKRRIMSRQGHLCNNQSGKLLSEIISPRLRHVFLGHLSRENNTPEIALSTVLSEVREALGERIASDLSISVAPQDGMSEVVRL